MYAGQLQHSQQPVFWECRCVGVFVARHCVLSLRNLCRVRV
jgi:hypothetical protein